MGIAKAQPILRRNRGAASCGELTCSELIEMSAGAGAFAIQFRVDFLIVEHLVERVVLQAKTVENDFRRFFLRLFIQCAVRCHGPPRHVIGFRC
jgi:hypothetical protein